MPLRINRRTFRFSLRSMFVLATVACCWLGWEVNTVLQRKALLRELEATQAYNIYPVEQWQATMLGAPPEVAAVPWVRRMLGDQAIQTIYYSPFSPGFDEHDLQRIAEMLPEAEALEIPAEPCHPGCFPRGTLVATPEGDMLIETIEPGYLLTTFLPGGELGTATVQKVFRTINSLLEVETDDGRLVTTSTQPLLLDGGKTIGAGQLQPGDVLVRCRGGAATTAKVRSVRSANRVESVFNVVLGEPQLFIAGGFVARSKPPAENHYAAVE